MPFVFTATIDGVNLHVSVTPNVVQHSTLLDERPHKHSFVEFHYIFGGKETLFFPKEDQRVNLTPGQIAMIPRGLYHCAETEEDASVSRLCFNFSADPEAVSGNPILSVFQRGGQALILKDPAVSAAMDRWRSILEDDKDPMAQTREGVILLDVVLDVFRRLSEGRSVPLGQNQTKQRQKWLIEEHIFTRYHAPEGLEGLAQKLYLSPRQTRKLVKSFYGEDYKTLIIRQRMEMAQIFLESKKLSLEEVAEKIGYRSYSGFHLAFVRQFGITPGQYREQKQHAGEK